MLYWMISWAFSPIIWGIFIACCIAMKIFSKMTSGRFTSEKRMDGKTVIVTGANTGIGKETALDLARRGARVIMACRNLEKAEAAAEDIRSRTGSQTVIVRHCDLSSLRSVRKFAEEIIKCESRLDVLINNAGLVFHERKVTEDGLELGMATNHFGPFLLTNLLLDLLKKSRPSRIINVSSLFHKQGTINFGNLNFEKDFDGRVVYRCNKLCNILMTDVLAERLRDEGVTANSLHPGVVYTGITRNAVWYRKIFLNIWFSLCKSAEEGAQTTIYLAVSDDVEHVTGEYFADCKVATKSSSVNMGLAKKLWEVSERLTGMTS